MKQIARIVLGVFLVVTLFTPAPSAFAAAKERTAVVVDFAGEVSIMKSGGEKVYAAKKEMKVKHGDRIITGKDSWITIEVDGDKTIKVGAKSYVSLEELTYEKEAEKTSVKVVKGNVFVNIKKKLKGDDEFEVKTPNAAMGARGTKFLVSYKEVESSSGKKENKSTLTVVEGVVQAVARATVKVRDEAGNLVEKQLTIAVEVEAGEDIEMVLAAIERELQNIAEEIQAMDEQGEVDPQKIKEAIEKKISKEEMDSMNVEKFDVAELDSFSLENILEELPDEGLTEEQKKIEEQLKKLLEDAKKTEDQQQQIQQNLINQQTQGNNIQYTLPQSPSGGSPSGNQEQYASAYLQSATTRDSDNDGVVDMARLVFSDAIDSNGMNFNGISFATQSGFVLGVVTEGGIEPENSNVLNLAVSEFQNLNPLPYNTGWTGTVSIPAGALRFGGLSYSGVSAFSVTDGAAPLLCRWNMDFSGGDKYVDLFFSEPINTSNGLDTAKLFVTDQAGSAGPVAVNNSLSEGSQENGEPFKSRITFAQSTEVQNILALELTDDGHYLKIESNTFKDMANNWGTFPSLNPLLQCNSFTEDTENPYVASVISSGAAIVLVNFNEFLEFSESCIQEYINVQFQTQGIIVTECQMAEGGRQLQLELQFESPVSGLSNGDELWIIRAEDLSNNILDEVSQETWLFNGSAWVNAGV
ncbi:MAG: FecR domain-containing protein [Eubacteriales bacterium]|nr:FecR domain-containing protein [Eubacteriales bacterium]